MKTAAWLLAGLLALVIAAAFLVPGWIDWRDQRQALAEAVEEASGTALVIDGTMTVDLLPQPRVVLTEVRWQGSDGLLLIIPEIVAELRFGSLLSGSPEVSSLRFIAPSLPSGLSPELVQVLGGLLRRQALADLDAVEIFALRIPLLDGRHDDDLIIDQASLQPAGSRPAAGQSFDMQGELLQQPLRASGRFSSSGEAACAGSLILDAVLDGLVQSLAFDGDWSCGPGFSGRMTAEGSDAAALLAALAPGSGPAAAAVPFAYEGPLVWDGSNLSLPGGELDLAGQGLAIEAQLTSEARPRLQGRVNATLIDLDQTATGGLLPLFAQSDRLLREAGLQTDIAFVMEAWRFREAALGPASGRYLVAAGESAFADLEMGLPGTGRLTLDGAFGLSAPAGPARLSVSSDNLRRLLLWAGLDEAQLPPERLRRLLLEGPLSGSWNDLRLDDLDLTLDAFSARGEARLQRLGSGPALDLVLTGERLNIDGYGLAWEALLRDASPLAGSDLALKADLSLGQVILADQKLEGLRLRMAADATGLTLEELTLAQVFGAALTASGQITRPDVDLELRVTGEGASLTRPAGGLAALGPFELLAVLDGPAEALTATVEVNALGGTLFASGLWTPGDRLLPADPWILALQHPDLAVLLAEVESPLLLADPSEPAVDLSALLVFAPDLSITGLSGRTGPLAVQDGALSLDAAGADDLSLALGPVSTAAWRIAETTSDLLAGPLSLPEGRAIVEVAQIDGEGWSAQALRATALSENAETAAIGLTGRLGDAASEAEVTLTGDRVQFRADLPALPLAVFQPLLPSELQLEGQAAVTADLTWQTGPSALATLDGRLDAQGDGRLTPAANGGADGALRAALLGGAAGLIDRIANLRVAVDRLFQSLIDREMTLTLDLLVRRGQVISEGTQLQAADLTLALDGFVDLPRWLGDYAWALRFQSLGEEPYYEERRQGSLDAPDILRSGLLFRGVTPPHLAE
ncbi:MAG: hypothetical protein AAFY02_01145 [Pseudomonadota bacterium]